MEAHLITPVSNGHKSLNTKHAASGISTSTTLSTAKKRKKAISDNALTNSSPTSLSQNYASSSILPITQNPHQHSDPPMKRKRGRPPKSILKQSTQLQRSESDSLDNEEEFEQPRSKRKNLQIKRTRGDLRADFSTSASMVRPVASSPSVASSSLCQLISRFQVQYEEMGRRYDEMGSLLAEMKKAVEEKRTPSEQEIRRELLDEIQQSILESIPKR